MAWYQMTKLQYEIWLPKMMPCPLMVAAAPCLLHPAYSQKPLAQGESARIGGVGDQLLASSLKGTLEQKQVVVETVWRFSEWTFENPIKLSGVTKETASYDTPEAAALCQLSAMIRRDVAWWSAGWDEESRQSLLVDAKAASQSDKKGAFTRDHWERAWTKLANCDAYLVAKAETPIFVILAYELRRTNAVGTIGTIGRDQDFNTNGVMRNRMCFVRRGEAWRQSNRYAGHAVWRLWRSGMDRETVLGNYSDKTVTK